MADPEWELSKENIAPLRQGRDTQVLNKALRTTKNELEIQRSFREADVRDAINGRGPYKDDPLESWSKYTKWIVENYPAGSDMLVRAIEEACRMYAKSERYRDDIRLVRLWIRYIDLREDKLDAFNYMNRRRIGESWSLFYEAWAVTLEIARQYDEAAKVYQIGREKQAKPLQRLALREEEYHNRMAARRRRDEKKKVQAEKKRLGETQREEARKGRDSSRSGSSLASAVLSGSTTNTNAVHEARAHSIRPALGQISEFQAKSGRRPLVLEGSKPPNLSTAGSHSHGRKESQRQTTRKYEIYADPDVEDSPAFSKKEEGFTETEEDEQFLPELARRNDLRKEDQGRLPSKWAGEVLPQDNTLRTRRQKDSNLSDEVYHDSSCFSPPKDRVTGAAVREIVNTRNVEKGHFEDILQDSRDPNPSTVGAASGSWLRNPLDGSGSPTINTKLAMKEVDDIFNSSHPLNTESGSVSPEVPMFSKSRQPAHERFTAGISQYDRFEEKPDWRLEASFGETKKPLNLENEGYRQRGVSKLADSRETLSGSTRRDPSDSLRFRTTDPLENSREGISLNKSPNESQPSREYDMTGFLASWCNNDSHFQLLEAPDPEVEVNEIFDLQCQQGIVSLNIDKFRWTGYSDRSYVVLADDLNNVFNLKTGFEENGSDEDDFKVVAVKISQGSNAWEYYIYRTIQSRVTCSLNTIPRALCFCEGNSRSYLILDSHSHCSLQEAQHLRGGDKFSESLSMFLIAGILRALEDLHGVEVIHSDVTLENILFRSELTADISKGPYSTSGENGWSQWGVLLVDYNHAVDAKHPQLHGLNAISLAEHVAGQGCEFVDTDYGNPNSEKWAYNGDCYSASICAAKLLGINGKDFKSCLNGLQHASIWDYFFQTMQGLHASSTAQDTCGAMRDCRERMEEILATDQLLSISLMQLLNQVVDAANNEDTAVGF